MKGSTITLLRAWAVLVGLTLATMMLASGGGATVPAVAGAAAVAITVVKGRQILTHYMDLRHAAPVWRTGLTAWLVVVGGVILGAYAMGGPG